MLAQSDYDEERPVSDIRTNEFENDTQRRDLKKPEESNQETRSETYSSSGTTESPEDLSGDEDGYALRADQEQAMLELLSSQMEDSQISEYNVRDKLVEINAQLANDPEPPSSDRRGSRVAFKEQLVDLIAPPPEYPTEEDESTISSAGENSPRKVSVQGEEDASSSSGDQSIAQTDSVQEVLVERGGKFTLTTKGEMESDQHSLDLDESENEEPASPGTQNESVTDGDDSDWHPREVSRPVSAPSSRRKPDTSAAKRSTSGRHDRPASSTYTMGHGSEDGFCSNYRSPYGLTAEEKERKNKELQKKKERESELERKKQEEERQKKEQIDDAFNAWLRKKREDAERHRREEADKRHKNDEKQKSDESVNYYQEWLVQKQKQIQKDQEMKKKEREDIELHTKETHTEQQRLKAYREWCIKKSQEKRAQAKEERRMARVTRLALRQSRKSQALAKAIQQAYMFRYLDYCGY